MGHCSTEQKCGCPHHKMVSVFITLIGLSFLFTALGIIGETLNNYAWPILLTLSGLQQLLGGKCKCCGNENGSEKSGGSCCGGGTEKS